ncbi:hypothetical protein FPQ18DRAFT_258174, partial [Pyronema domesticum]
LTYRSSVVKNHPGALTWILEHECYKKWCRLSTEVNSSAFLWVSRNSGCGKTVISRFLMDSIKASLKSQGLKRQHVLYFFFDDKYDTQKTALSLLKALLHQIIRLSPDSIRHFMPEYLSYGDGVVHSLGTLWNVFFIEL